ncbi:hypothetical protein HDU92_007864 [Lobulomyces angularis]|nr:hypothetical protein HDU92_007864 [Lobulomyces angularis]
MVVVLELRPNQHFQKPEHSFLNSFKHVKNCFTGYYNIPCSFDNDYDQELKDTLPKVDFEVYLDMINKKLKIFIKQKYPVKVFYVFFGVLSSLGGFILGIYFGFGLNDLNSKNNKNSRLANGGKFEDWRWRKDDNFIKFLSISLIFFGVIIALLTCFLYRRKLNKFYTQLELEINLMLSDITRETFSKGLSWRLNVLKSNEIELKDEVAYQVSKKKIFTIVISNIRAFKN